jgi:hypothetical protein
VQQDNESLSLAAYQVFAVVRSGFVSQISNGIRTTSMDLHQTLDDLFVFLWQDQIGEAIRTLPDIINIVDIQRACMVVSA